VHSQFIAHENAVVQRIEGRFVKLAVTNAASGYVWRVSLGPVPKSTLKNANCIHCEFSPIDWFLEVAPKSTCEVMCIGCSLNDTMPH
jgi:hypothetical protein